MWWTEAKIGKAHRGRKERGKCMRVIRKVGGK